jgi:replicative DNA helicase
VSRDGETLPANVEAEGFVLGSIILDCTRNLPLIRSRLQPDDFSVVKHQRIYRRALELDDRGIKVDRVTLAESLKSHRELSSVGIGYLNSLDDHLPQIPNIASYADIVKEKSVRRQIIVSADSVAKRGCAASKSPARTAACPVANDRLALR